MSPLSRSVPRSWSWTSTLQLPKSTFPARTLPAQQAIYLKQCTDDLYAWQRQNRSVDNTFTLHDGPPYANGDVHVGHALNKILKDIICRYQLTLGKRVDYVPGWDCHGLPIELKALQRQKQLFYETHPKGAEMSPMSVVDVRRTARELAESTVKKQKSSFRSWGVMADWDHAWRTMDKSFELDQLGIFQDMVEKGLIYRRFKPVFWSPSSHTALAEAEVEYKDDHVSTAAIIRYPIVKLSKRLAALDGVDIHNLWAIIWTTTPWTIPANRAIAVNPEMEYLIVQTMLGQFIVAASRIHELRDLPFLRDMSIVQNGIKGADLISCEYANIFRTLHAAQPFLAAAFVSDESGTGLVHCAPGHGMEDYELCLKAGIEAYAPVDDNGRYVPELSQSDLGAELVVRGIGMEVLDEGNQTVLKLLRDNGMLLDTREHVHKYPYDWRSKKPLIIRATEQWFADLSNIKEKALESLQSVRFVPESGRARLESFIKSRSEWCISRQRAWGVPIPALYCKTTHEAVLTKESVGHIIDVIKVRGIDAWWTDAGDDPAWTLPSLREKDGSTNYQRGQDTMDVWFDSGTSWMQMRSSEFNTKLQADVYLEGSDQHRGWFQSSLLTRISEQTVRSSKAVFVPPFKTLITHGFTLDSKGHKMSKSLGNIIAPSEIIDGTLLPPVKQKKNKHNQNPVSNTPTYDSLGPDALRLWVASSNYTTDVSIGTSILKTVHSSLHKLRVTLKLLLGSLMDFDPHKDRVPYSSLTRIDHIALFQLSAIAKEVKKAYDNHEFYTVVSFINKYTNVCFSAFYFETLKDRLYTDGKDSTSRRAAQTVLYEIYSHLLSMLSPITPLLVEEAWHHTPAVIKNSETDPLKRLNAEPPPEWTADFRIGKDYALLQAANTAVKAAQEEARSKKLMGSSLESYVYLYLPKHISNLVRDTFTRYSGELDQLFVVSHVEIAISDLTPLLSICDTAWVVNRTFSLDGHEAKAYVYAPSKAKCNRCWRYVVNEGNELCDRCTDVINVLREQQPELFHDESENAVNA